jgi:hypothetical protein
LGRQRRSKTNWASSNPSQGKKRKFSVLFADNKLRTMSSTGIQKSANLQTENHVNNTFDGPDNESIIGDGFIDDVEASSSSSDEENNVLNDAFIE